MKETCLKYIDKGLELLLTESFLDDEIFKGRSRGLIVLWSITTTVMWLYVLYCYFGFGPFNPVTIGGLICTILHTMAPLVLKVFQSIPFTAVTISLTGLGFQTLFCLYSGGIFSPAAIWLSLHPIILAYFGSVRLIYFSVVLNFFIVIGLYLVGFNGALPENTLPTIYRDGMILTSYIGLDILIAAFTIVAIRMTISYNKKLEENNEIIENLVRVLSHDINNSLSIIKLASNSLAADKENKSKESVLRIKRAANQITDITKSAKSWMTTHDKMNSLSKDVILINDVIEHIQFTFREKLEDKKIDLKINNETSHKTSFYGDKTATLYEVVNNVISNAIKFSFENNEILIEVDQDDEYVHVKIRDFGIGVDDKTISEAFVPTSKTSRRGTKNEIGTGYGLPIAFTLLKQMNGHIAMENMESIGEKAGTRISLLFPKVIEE